MRIATLSTSRADYSALMVARLALLGMNEHVLLQMIHHAAPSFDVMRDDFRSSKPDLVLIHGDRWDALMAATAATVSRVPIAHVGGGDVTRGAYDDRFRLAITALADWHLVGTDEAALRLSGLVDSARVFVIGELAIDWLASVDLSAAWRGLDMRLGMEGQPYVLINWQPETTAADGEMNRGLGLIIEALKLMQERYMPVFIKPGDDAGGPEAAQMIKLFRVANPRVRYVHDGMSRVEYAAAMKHCCCVVGNSSSGLIEAPVFSRPFVLVGDRQDGRALPSNTVRAPTSLAPEGLANTIEVHAGVGALSSNEATTVGNPYGDGKAGEKLVAAVRHIAERSRP